MTMGLDDRASFNLDVLSDVTKRANACLGVNFGALLNECRGMDA